MSSKRSKSLSGSSELVLVMPARKGFIEALPTMTYANRLKTFAEVFSKLRVASRESRLLLPYSDIIDRLETIHAVHISLVDTDKVMLAVAFDRPWEPYIRIIWRVLGRLLDVFLCNCEGYAGNYSTDQGFQKFAEWVRWWQIDNETFYVPGCRTVGDVLYLEQLEELYRKGGTRNQAAGLTYKTAEDTAAQVRNSALASLELYKMATKAITAFHGVSRYYPPSSEDHKYLVRAAQSVLSEVPPSGQWLAHVPDTDPATRAAVNTLRGTFETEIGWFEQLLAVLPPSGPQRPVINPNDVQGGILKKFHANIFSVALVQITDVDAARGSLQKLRDDVTTAGQQDSATDFVQIALTWNGLQRLGATVGQLAEFPAEFQEGMEERAGLLGDRRRNHPDSWALPARNWPPGNSSKTSVSLASVDIVVEFATHESGDPPHRELHSHPLRPQLDALDALPGLAILSVELTRSLANRKEHFGFKDGISQPEPNHEGVPRSNADTVPPQYNNDVSWGEVFYGRSNDRGDPAIQLRTDSLLEDASFLVMRKLSQDVEAFKHLETQHPGAIDGLMGRQKNGDPLLPSAGDNGFDYTNDPQGTAVPLFAHIRRANPRVGGDAPRIIRRGSSYGPAYDDAPGAERGLLFKAFNASIAEQFEVIQRWLTGGNSTNSYSRYSDPFLGVHEPGQDRSLVAPGAGGNLSTIPIPKQLVTLQWGIYLYVPTISSLTSLASVSGSTSWFGANTEEKLVSDLVDLATKDRDAACRSWKQYLEERDQIDSGLTARIWKTIRDHHNGVLKTPFATLVADPGLVIEVLNRADISVSHYKTRLGETFGNNYLGMDNPQHDVEAKGPNAVLSSVSVETSFIAALAVCRGLLGQLGNIKGEADIPLPKYADTVLAKLAEQFFGIPDSEGQFVKPGGEPAPGAETSHCPAHIISVSRYANEPRPDMPNNFKRDNIAIPEGKRMRQNVDAYIDHVLANGGAFTDLTQAIREKTALDNDPVTDRPRFASVLLGALLGYMPTVNGNFVTTAREWIKSRQFWRLQDEFIRQGGDETNVMEYALNTLRPILEEAMCRRPVPAMLTRTAAMDLDIGGVSVKKGEIIAVGLSSGTAGSDFKDPSAVFGGKYGTTIHACPGREMATGTLLAMFCAMFMQKGTWLPSASNLALTYRPVKESEAAH